MSSIIRNLPKSIIYCTRPFILNVAKYSNLHQSLRSMPISRLQYETETLIKQSISHEKNSIGMGYYQSKLKNELNKEEPKIYIEDLKDLFLLSKTDQDVDLLAKSIIVYSNYNNIDPISRDDMTRRFMVVVYLLKKSHKLIEYYNDSKYSRLFRNHRAIDVFYELLYDQMRYDDLIKIFREHLKNGYSIDNETRYNKVPASHLNMVSKALIKQNKLDSLDTFKKILKLVYLDNTNIVHKSVMLRNIYFAITMDNGLYAYEILKSGFFNDDQFLLINLRAMVYSKIKNDDLLFLQLKKMFNQNIAIFPFTFKCLKEDSLQRNVNIQEQIDVLFKKAVFERRFSDIDLVDMILMEPDSIFSQGSELEGSTEEIGNPSKKNDFKQKEFSKSYTTHFSSSNNQETRKQSNKEDFKQEEFYKPYTTRTSSNYDEKRETHYNSNKLKDDPDRGKLNEQKLKSNASAYNETDSEKFNEPKWRSNISTNKYKINLDESSNGGFKNYDKIMTRKLLNNDQEGSEKSRGSYYLKNGSYTEHEISSDGENNIKRKDSNRGF